MVHVLACHSGKDNPFTAGTKLKLGWDQGQETVTTSCLIISYNNCHSYDYDYDYTTTKRHMILELQSFRFNAKRSDLDLVETKEEVGLVVELSGDAFEEEEFQNVLGLSFYILSATRQGLTLTLRYILTPNATPPLSGQRGTTTIS
eukprot:scaffold126_cov142-Skeletonema_marinoi.AAC.5